MDTWLQEGNDTAAQNALDDIPNILSLSGDPLVEYNYFDTLKSLQITAIQNEVGEDTMVANNLTTFTRIAEAGHYYASVQAQALLNKVYGFTYTPEVFLPTSEQQYLIGLPPASILANTEAAMLEARPNPARHTTVFKYRLPKGEETGKIVVTDLKGHQVAYFDVYGESGNMTWDIKELSEGIYLYRLVTEKSMLTAKRLVIVR